MRTLPSVSFFAFIFMSAGATTGQEKDPKRPRISGPAGERRPDWGCSLLSAAEINDTGEKVAANTNSKGIPGLFLWVQKDRLLLVMDSELRPGADVTPMEWVILRNDEQNLRAVHDAIAATQVFTLTRRSRRAVLTTARTEAPEVGWRETVGRIWYYQCEITAGRRN